MKKLLIKLISLITATVLSVGFLSGCDLVTTNAERDMKQVIATVSIDEGLSDSIYKRELVSAFNSSGYLYVAYYGYTVSDTYQMLFDNIVESRIIVQQSKKALTDKTSLNKDASYFAKAEAVNPDERTSKEKVLTTVNYKGTKMTEIKKTDDLDLFLTEYEYLNAKYNVLVSANALLENYKDAEEDEKEYFYESLTVTNRTTLTAEEEEAENEELLKTKEVTLEYAKQMNKINKDSSLGLTIFDDNGKIAYNNKYDLNLDVYKKYIEKFDLTSKENKRAVKKLVKEMADLGFIESTETEQTIDTVDKLLNLTYFKDSLKNEFETAIVAKYELALENDQERLVNDEDTLYQEYVTLFNTQKEAYTNNYKTYETALSNANSNTFVVYNPDYGKGNYGYISNLLIGFTAEQTALLDAKTAEKNVTDEDVLAYRQTLLNSLKVKDLRETWVLSNYGTYDEATGVFTFDKKYCPTESLRKFNGSILDATPYTKLDGNGEEETLYSYKGVYAGEMDYKDFYKNVFCKVMNIDDTEAISGQITGIEEVNSLSRRINEATLKKYTDLIYAYSTDSGSLKENYGYVYSPFTSGTIENIKGTYVQEFADAAKRLVNKGVGSYEVVATKFGYHIMLCTCVLTPSTEIISKEQFDKDILQKGTVANLYKEYKLNLITSSVVSNITQSFIKENLSKVTYNESAYEDLINEDADEHAGHNH